MAVLDNSRDFLSKIRYHLPLLGHYFQINAHRRAAVVLALHLEFQYQLLIVRRRLRIGDPDFLTLWLEKVSS